MEIKDNIYSHIGRYDPIKACCISIANDPELIHYRYLLHKLEAYDCHPVYTYNPSSPNRQVLTRIYPQERDELIKLINDRVEEIKKSYGL